MLLVTSPNGKTGRSIIEKLKLSNVPFKVLTSSNQSRNQLQKIGVKNIYVGNLRNTNDVKEAIKGTNQTYLITPNFFYNEFSVIENFISIANKIPNYKIVFHSVIHPHIKLLPHHWSKMRIEQRLITSKLNWIVLQPTMYMQNILPQIKMAKLNKHIGMPIPIDKKLSMVDLNDVTEIAFKAITENCLDYGIYELVGHNLSLNDQAQIISKLLGLNIVATQFTLSGSKSILKIPFKGKYGENTYDIMFEYYTKYGLSGNSSILKKLLSREPSDFYSLVKIFLRDN